MQSAHNSRRQAEIVCVDRAQHLKQEKRSTLNPPQSTSSASALVYRLACERSAWSRKNAQR